MQEERDAIDRLMKRLPGRPAYVIPESRFFLVNGNVFAAPLARQCQDLAVIKSGIEDLQGWRHEPDGFLDRSFWLLR